VKHEANTSSVHDKSAAVDKPTEEDPLLNIRDRGTRNGLLAVALTILVLGAIGLAYSQRQPKLTSRALRIGVDQAAPYQSWAPGHGAVGFSVDLLNEAARRTGIKLEWVNRVEGPGPAIRARSVDMWPLVSVTFGKLNGIYMAEPYFSNQYAIAWLGDAMNSRSSTKDWNGLVVAAANLPVTLQYAAKAAPGSIQDRTADRSTALQHVCQGLADGAFMEIRLLEANLLHRPDGCEDKQFQVEVFSDLQVPMSLSAFPEFRAEADALRREIDRMFRDGSYSRIANRWFLFSNIEAHALSERATEARFRRFLFGVIFTMAVLIALLIWMYRRSTNAARAAEAASRTKSEFLANVSHEVRTPMTGVLGMADLLINSPLTSEQREYVSGILASARLQLSILNDLLDSAKMESGMLILASQDFSPASLVNDLITMYHGMAAEQGLQLSAEITGLPTRVKGDARRLQQVLGNLISNAIKFTPSGKVWVEATVGANRSAPGHIELIFAVRDTGIGIPTEAHERIFENFTQVESSATRRYGGSGLGLNICRHLIQQMGGSIHVESKAGAGSTFWFSITLPRCDEPRPTQERDAAAPLCLQVTLPILVAEDNRVNQRVVCSQLQRLGLRCEIAQNGREALDKCSVSRFAAVLMDCQMPEMDGWEAARRIRQLPGGHLPVIAMTASTSAADRKLASEAGMDDFIAKPFSQAELVAVLSRWLDTGDLHRPRQGAALDAEVLTSTLKA